MKLMFPLKIATTTIILGLITLSSNPVKAATWVRNNLVVNKDNFYDSRFQTTNFGSHSSLAIGQLNEQAGEQVAYLGFNLQSVMNEITPFLNAGAEIRNLQATLRFNQTYNGGNDPNGVPLNLNTAPLFPPVPTVNVREVVYTNSWRENAAVDRDNVTLGQSFFGGGISEGANERSNTLVNGSFNTFVRNLLENNTPEFSLAIEAVETFSLTFPPFNTFPVDTIVSREGSNINEQPRIDLSFQLWNESFNVIEEDNPTPNFKLQSLAGGRSLNEHRLVKGRDQLDEVLDETHWIWSNNTPTRFELQCSNNQATVTFFANYDNSSNISITSPVNTCENLEGLKLFSVVKQVVAGTSIEICVDEAGGSSISDFCSSSNLAVDGGGISDETFFYFTDPTNSGGLGSAVTNLNGEITLGWQNNNNPQEASANQRVAMQLVPLSTYSDPFPQNSVPQNSVPQNNNTNEPSNAPSVPEPTSVVSLIFLGLSGLKLKLSRKNRN